MEKRFGSFLKRRMGEMFMRGAWKGRSLFATTVDSQLPLREWRVLRWDEDAFIVDSSRVDGVDVVL
jgi:hypothetical protein